MSATPIFELQGVTKRFGSLVALEEVSLTIGAGERVALVGPSGAGKSTLLNLLNGSLTADAGAVRLFGREVAQLTPRQLRHTQRRIGTIYQQFHLVGNLPVIHNLNAGRLAEWGVFKSLASLVRPLGVSAARESLARVGIADKLYERTSSLSGGQQQRVALARVLLQRPSAVLADEPIASLDPERSRQMMDLLRQTIDEQRRDNALVVSLHEVAYALSHCERLIGLKNGRILFDQPVQAVSNALITELYAL